MKGILVPTIAFFLVPIIGILQDTSSKLSPRELDELHQALKADSVLAQMVEGFGDPVMLYEQFKTNLRADDSLWRYDQEHVKPFLDVGSTRRFEMLPLIDWFSSSDSLVHESGVAYLLRTDDATILFDVGLNRQDADPSPLLMNMERLGVRLEDIDMIVISHPHSDHVGGSKWEDQGSFSLTSHQIPLGHKQVFTPIPMVYPGVEPVYTRQPTRIAKGVATIGVIQRPLFFGETEEQALAIDVEGKGIVIVSGCGHQTIERLLQRTERLFQRPIYALLGGFHLPLTEGRNIHRYYKYFVTGRPPWVFLEAADITNLIGVLKRNGVHVVGVSGHDTCDSTIAMFKSAFGSSYVDIAVGKTVTFR